MAVVILGLLAAAPAAADGDAPSWSPSAVFVQAGASGDARSLALGAAWDWGWNAALGRGRAGGYWELALGRWRSRLGADAGRTHVATTRIGLAPVLRLNPWGDDSGVFVELGIGANALFPVYRSESKRFSTVFNFGEHLGLGLRFGAAHRHELALRVAHYSNAGIKEPNPGETFAQLRYAFRF